MSEEKQKDCPRCGNALSDEVPGKLCARCVMKMNLSEDTLDTMESGDSSVPPLSAEEMSERFPQFEIMECLGRGGMGVVYRARQKALERVVAIKVLAGEWQGDAGFAQRFEKEAKMLAQMSHPNIVTVHDFGQTNGLCFIVMEYVDGVNLRDLLIEGKMEPEQALAIVPSVCEALEYAHGKGVVHRDIKPENLLLDREGRVKIADFGIASLVGATGEKSGTPPYMAPEQSGGGVDRRADIYALGVVLYEMLTGERPAKDFVVPSKRVEVDVRIDEMVLRALEREPEKRYQTAGEFRSVVETMAAPPAASEPATADVRPRNQSLLSLMGRKLASHAKVIGVAVLAALFALAWMIMSLRESDERPVQPEQIVEDESFVAEDFIEGLNSGEIGGYDLSRAGKKHFAQMEVDEIKDLYSKAEGVENLRFKISLQAKLMRELAKRLPFDEVFAMVSQQSGDQRLMEIRAVFVGSGMGLKTFLERLTLISKVEGLSASRSYFDGMTKNGLLDLGDLDGIGKISQPLEQSLLVSLRGLRERQVRAEFTGQEAPAGNVVKFTEKLYESGVVSKELFLDVYYIGRGYSAEEILKKLLLSEDLSSAKNFKSVTGSLASILVEQNPPQKMRAVIEMATSAKAVPNHIVESGFTSWLKHDVESAVEWFENERGEMPPQAVDEIEKALSASSVTQSQVLDQKERSRFAEDFAKLPKEGKQQWHEDSQRATRLFEQKKIRECLAMIKSLNKRIHTSPAVHNLAGTCHVENRDFKLALASFQSAFLYNPRNLNIAFNLAEVEFVTRDYKTARISFEKVRQGFERQGQAMASMEVYCQFKMFLCHLMLEDEERTKKAADTFERDRPKELIHFYSQAALSFHGGDFKAAKVWLEESKKSVPEDQQHEIYRDAFSELGYINKE